MNTPESITVDLEHAKMLKEAGWTQDEALLWWASKMHPDPYDESIVWELSNDSNPIGVHDWCKQAGTFAAPTAQEILRRLPTGMSSQRGDYLLTCDIGGLRIWNVTYLDEDGRCFFHEDEEVLTEDPSLANAASEMWCYLKKNNLLNYDS